MPTVDMGTFVAVYLTTAFMCFILGFILCYALVTPNNNERRKKK